MAEADGEVAEPLQRVALVVDGALERGAAANVAAIIMGQLALIRDGLFSEDRILDGDGIRHSGIRFSTVVLKAGSGQLAKLAQRLAGDESVSSVSFSRVGQGLHNRFDYYRSVLSATTAVDLAGVGIAGEDHYVRALTKPFSILN